ncbi:transposon-transfer assisting family protein [Ruminococcaceae bacterium OttesenSCG-928-L11]|nr:transposon-transfer assisting family protein [Ruminococcaceae bacterium OttesenSCG-928-L11]
MEFTKEELAVMRPFDGSCRATLLWELRQSLPDVYQPDVKRAMKSAIGKLAAMNDDEFDAQGLDTDFYHYDMEDYE